jgi:hypothetical protein
MRGGSLLLTALALVGTAVVASPARAGDDHYVPVRALDDRLTVVGEDCAGGSGAAPDVKIGASDKPYHGRGTARLTTAADSLGGLLVHDLRPLRGVRYAVRPLAGEAPQGTWRAEVNGDLLTSDPVDLTPGRWSVVWLEDATLHGPDGWTGTIDDYVAAFGHHGHWTAGLLTGGCLGSSDVRLDSVGTRHTLYDFEPRTWVTIRVREDGPPYDHAIDPGDPVVVRAAAHRWNVRTDSAETVRGADLVLQRERELGSGWRTVTHGATWHGHADHAAWWRTVWRRPGADIRSGPVHQPGG